MANAPVTRATSSTGHPPNIILILADDLGYGDLSCQNPESKIHTPRLDSLASQGMCFTSAHAPSSLCTPSRYSIMTGQFCWRTRLKSGVLDMWDEPLIPAERMTVAGMLRGQGYATGCFGKWHLGLAWPFFGSLPRAFDKTVTASDIDWTRRIAGGPVDHGFDYFFGVNTANQPPFTYILNDHVLEAPTQRYETVSGLQSHWGGPGVAGWDWSQLLPTVVSNAGAWLQQRAAAADQRPFFLYLALTGPHQPVVPTAQFSGSSGAGLYGDYVQELDWATGQLLDQLDASGEGTNTLVLFTSDNGPDEFTYARLQEYSHASMGTLRGIKNDLWEGGHRVPFLARWPGRIRAGSKNSKTICHVDIMRTLAEVVGAPLGANAAEDSVSFLPALLDSPGARGRTSLLLESGPGQFGLWTNKWMFIDSKTGDGHNPELEPLWFKQSRGYPATNTYASLLYDLEQDPTEATNLYPTQTDLASQLQAAVRKQRGSQAWSGAKSADWTNCGNWSRSDSAEGCDLIYSNVTGARFCQDLRANFSINSLSIGAVTQRVILRPGGPFTLTISNGIDMGDSRSDLTLQTPLCIAQSQMWNVRSNRTLTVNAPTRLDGAELRIYGGGTVLLSNTVSGPGRLVMRSRGLVVLSGSNTYTGGTEISGGGFLVAADAQAVGSGRVEIPNNSTLQIEPGVTLTNTIGLSGFGGTDENTQRGALAIYHSGLARLEGPVQLSNSAGIRAHGNGGTLSLGGAISGTGNLTIMRSEGNVIFAAKNTYNGTTFVQGKLKLAPGRGALPKESSLSLENACTASLDLGDNIQEVGSLAGGGMSGGNVALGNGRLIVNQVGTSTFSGSINGAGGLTKINSGKLILNGICSYAGATIVLGGILQIDKTLGGSSVTVSNAILTGTGIITGPVALGGGGILSPGPGTRALTISNRLVLAEGSTTSIELNCADRTCSRVVGMSEVTYGGTLRIKFVGQPTTWVGGERAGVFRAARAAGKFASIIPAPGPGLAWSFDPGSGNLTVVAQAALQRAVVDRNHLRFSWSEPGFHLQVQTNSLSGEPADWFDYPGGEVGPVIVPIGEGHGALFLRLIAPGRRLRSPAPLDVPTEIPAGAGVIDETR